MQVVKKILKWIGYFFLGLFVLAGIGAIFGGSDSGQPSKTETTATKETAKAPTAPEDADTFTFKDYVQSVLMANDEPQQIIEYHVSKSKTLTPADVPAVRAYISQYALTKSKDITLKTAVSWVELEKDKGVDISKKVNADKLIFNINPFDNSFRILEEMLEQTLNDPDSYEHVQTIYKFRFDGARPHVVVWSKFRANNAYGAKVLQTIDLKFDLATLKPFE